MNSFIHPSFQEQEKLRLQKIVIGTAGSWPDLADFVNNLTEKQLIERVRIVCPAALTFHPAEPK